MQKIQAPVFVMNLKPLQNDCDDSETPQNHIQRREKELKVANVLKPKFNQNVSKSTKKPLYRPSKLKSKQSSNSDLQYFTTNSIQMSKSSNQPSKSSNNINDKENVIIKPKVHKKEVISPEFGQIRKKKSSKPPMFVVKLTDKENVFRLEEQKQDDHLGNELKKISRLEEELYGEIDEVDSLLRKKKNSKILSKVLTVKRNEVISSLKKMKKHVIKPSVSMKKERNSSQKNTPMKKTPKKCDFIATTESIKHLKKDPRNSSPKIELFSPKKTQELAQMTRKNIQRYENSTQRHLNTTPKTVNYQKVKGLQRRSKIRSVLKKKYQKQKMLAEKAAKISQELNLYITGSSPDKERMDKTEKQYHQNRAKKFRQSLRMPKKNTQTVSRRAQNTENSQSVNISSYVNRIVRASAQKRRAQSKGWTNSSSHRRSNTDLNGDFKLQMDPCFDRVEIKRSYSMKELGTILDQHEDEDGSLSITNFPGDADISVNIGKQKVKTTRTQLKGKGGNRRKNLTSHKKNTASRKKSSHKSQVNSMNTSLVADQSSYKPVQDSIRKVKITDDFIKNSIKNRKSKLRDKLERKLGLNQFNYTQQQSRNLYSASAKKKRRAHTLINKQITDALGSSHQKKLQENWADEWVQKAERLNFDDIKLDRTPGKNIKTEPKRRNVQQYGFMNNNDNITRKGQPQASSPYKNLARNIDFNQVSISDYTDFQPSHVRHFSVNLKNSIY